MMKRFKQKHIVSIIFMSIGFSNALSFDLKTAQLSTVEVRVNTIANTYDTGSAVYLGNNRYLSAYHVIEDAHTLNLVVHNKTHRGKIKQVSAGHDLAVIESNIQGVKPVKISDRLRAGEPIYVLSSKGLLLQGHVAKITYNEAILSMIVPTGTSGGGVFNQNNELLGIISRSDISQGLTYMTRITALPQVKDRFENKPSIDRNSKHYDYGYCTDPQTLKTWKNVTKEGDVNMHGLHALFLGLCEKVKRHEMTTEEANFFFLKTKKELFGI